MRIEDLLANVSHRPWTLPDEPWRYYQEWNNVVFLHWEVDYDELKKFVPYELEIDLYRGKPWISLVAFTMERVRPRYLPSFPLVSTFHEVNIRTYVRKSGKAGVYFLSMEGGTRISCVVAKFLSGLPYRYSEMSRRPGTYRSVNRPFNDRLEISYVAGAEQVVKSDLDIWLTERYALFQETPTSINEFDIHHIEWPICKLTLEKLEIDYPRFQRLKHFPDSMHYSPGVRVIAWDKRMTLRNCGH